MKKSIIIALLIICALPIVAESPSEHHSNLCEFGFHLGKSLDSCEQVAAKEFGLHPYDSLVDNKFVEKYYQRSPHSSTSFCVMAKGTDRKIFYVVHLMTKAGIDVYRDHLSYYLRQYPNMSIDNCDITDGETYSIKTRLHDASIDDFIELTYKEEYDDFLGKTITSVTVELGGDIFK